MTDSYRQLNTSMTQSRKLNTAQPRAFEHVPPRNSMASETGRLNSPKTFLNHGI